jgi:hypothetical protein
MCQIIGHTTHSCASRVLGFLSGFWTYRSNAPILPPFGVWDRGWKGAVGEWTGEDNSPPPSERELLLMPTAGPVHHKPFHSPSLRHRVGMLWRQTNRKRQHLRNVTKKTLPRHKQMKQIQMQALIHKNPQTWLQYITNVLVWATKTECPCFVAMALVCNSLLCDWRTIGP